MRWILTALLVTTAAAVLTAQRAPRVNTGVECAAILGSGVKSARDFCDVLIGGTPAESVAITIPKHTGTATLSFDLHNRFTVPPIVVPGALTYSRHEAVVAIIRSTGDVVSKAAVVREFRTPADLFDQIQGGGRPGGVKAVAPGPAEPIRVTIPAGVNAIGIVGVRLNVTTRASQDHYDTPGRPVAVVSNIRVQYR